MKHKKKQKNKDKIISVFKSYKTIIILSFLINVILLIFSYNIMRSNNEYVFEGSNEYIRIKDGLIVLNNDINIFYGNNIKYINEEDCEIISLSLGYYTINEEGKLEELIVSNYEEKILLSDAINNFTNFNIYEKNNKEGIFTHKNVNQLNNGIYFVLKGKDIEQNEIEYKIKLNVTKISKF